jgi:Protein of unknown function DUF262
MPSFVTTFAGLFEHHLDGSPTIDQIEIPRIQRDYAQGRPDDSATVIRETFLDVLCDALTGADPVGLDFVYGEVRDGILYPLDGQQRLTTLFLLHWYLASGTGRLTGEEEWIKFSYSTRPSARLFCERLAKVSLPRHDEKPSAWITDQPWCLYVWRLDPTIQSMLVVIDAIHERLAAAELDEAWCRLVDPNQPAISFDFLPIENMGSPADLYIKMNSRGKPLTDFENFKARLEKALDGSPLADDFAHKIDGDWADVLWPLHGNNNTIDDEFLNYISFVVELCEWKRGDTAARRQPLLTRAKLSFATNQLDAVDNLTFLFHSFDTWVGEDLHPFFEAHFATSKAVTDSDEARVVIFGTDANPNLFEACIKGFGNEQRFGSQRKLLLYAVLLHRIHSTDDFPRRLRIVRNLLAASEDELRPEAMPQILADVERVVLSGDLEGVTRLNQAQRGDELAKRSFLNAHPELGPAILGLEDHDLLRGSLVAIDLDPHRLKDRAAMFEQVFSDANLTPSLTGALLALGQYQRSIGVSLKFGAPLPSGRWRDLLTGLDRENAAPTRSVLAEALDRLSGPGPSSAERLQTLCDDWLREQERERRFDWRYYLVRYPAMRVGKSGIYRSPDGVMGYSLCMLEGDYLNGYHRDPYLNALVNEADAAAAVVGTDNGGPWFIGPAVNERWMELKNSATQLRAVPAGFELKPPSVEQHRSGFDSVVVARDDIEQTGDCFLLAIPQVMLDEELVDTIDRIQTAAVVVSDLLEAGC